MSEDKQVEGAKLTKVRRLLRPDHESVPVQLSATAFHVLFRLLNLDELSGGAQVVLRLAGYLQRRGHAVTLSVPQGWLTQDDLGDTGIRLTQDMMAADFIVGTYWTTITEIANTTVPGHKVAFIQCDEPGWMNAGERFRQAASVAFSQPGLDYIAISHQLAVACVEKYGTSCTRWIDGNGVDSTTFSPRLDNHDRRNAVCAIYRGLWFKNDTFVLNLMERLKQSIPGLTAAMAGFRRFNNPVLDNYLVDPPLDEMAALYSGSDIYLSASRIEGSPLPPLEAMACGCIPVVTGIGTEEYMRHGHNGFIIDPDDLEGAVETVVRIYADEGLRRRVIRNGLVTARERTWASVGTQFEAALVDIAVGKGVHV